jgi:hypothetical protein
MKPRLLVPVIIAQALVIILLAWALVYFGRDEFKLFEQREESEVIAASRVSSHDGIASVRITPSAQQASGIATAPLQAYALQPRSEVFGMVVNPQPLIELRARYLAALQDIRVLQPALARSQAEYRRVNSLYRDDRNASLRALQSAEAEWKADQARLAAAQAQASNLRGSMRALWGDVLAEWAADENSRPFTRLMNRDDALIQLTVPFDSLRADMPAALRVAPLGTEDAGRDASFISASPQVDPALAGRTFFYRAPGSDLRVGMRVTASVQNGGKALHGVIVPAAAVVWSSGKAWVYLKRGADNFIRHEISASESAGDGWFEAAGLEAGDKVVVSGAQLLLSEEFRYQIRNENQE